MPTIAISRHENHPVAPGIMQETEDNLVVVVFGMAKRRGDNMVYSTKVTDDLYTVLTKWKLELYTRRAEVADKPFDWHETRQVLSEDSGKSMEYVGIAYNIRRTMDGEKYKQLVTEIANALAPKTGQATIPGNSEPVAGNPPPVPPVVPDTAGDILRDMNQDNPEA